MNLAAALNEFAYVKLNIEEYLPDIGWLYAILLNLRLQHIGDQFDLPFVTLYAADHDGAFNQGKHPDGKSVSIKRPFKLTTYFAFLHHFGNAVLGNDDSIFYLLFDNRVGIISLGTKIEDRATAPVAVKKPVAVKIKQGEKFILRTGLVLNGLIDRGSYRLV